MIIGFTGTQDDITMEQFDTIHSIFKAVIVTEAHHGDCIGADFTFHQLCQHYDFPIIIHPPLNETKRAFAEGAARTLEPKDYLVRNHDIVDAVDAMIVCPKQDKEVLRSGTWATWRYTNKLEKVSFLILPNGAVR